MMPETAREQCKKILGNFTHRYHVHHSIRRSEGMTLGAFVADDYATWVDASRPRSLHAAGTISIPKRSKSGLRNSTLGLVA